MNLSELKFKVPLMGKTSIPPPFPRPPRDSLPLKLHECSGWAESKMGIVPLFRRKFICGFRSVMKTTPLV
ncbi:hypothetical protein HanIR_Chr06g0281141 [Helianthus annuus]|nr:hypothetical protein HanIR_Chr06g0281141 [Helianthus annuus]